MKLACMATALFAVGALASAPAPAAPSADATAALQDGPQYLPANPTDPGGLKSYNHAAQFEESIEAHELGKNKTLLQEKKAEIKAKLLKNVNGGPPVKAGAYTLAPAPGGKRHPSSP